MTAAFRSLHELFNLGGNEVFAVSHRFVQCCGRQKAHNASNGIGGDFPQKTKCGLLSSPLGKTSAYIWHNYAMIACRAESLGWLKINIGQNCAETPLVPYYQGKMTRSSLV